ncbi:GlxA family transcriptional regulator [Pedobacter rhodius]|uniref:Helix-turn-helix domain-containing protein n=1 Tax=Pedobacter rhodius TaxID=3004098 RepID=A0ABT4L2L1_9SPHI|nr:helix-turn-helix domain-containing protein [Pedobacter sp. SJ11]MCZ4225412.1 helix-turn-helix domain-containing protein [Pedobacter sp. SJ11]
MKHVSILVPIEAVPSAIVDPRYMFTAVNQFLINSGKAPAFEIQLVGLSAQVQLNSGAFAVNTDILISDLKKTDLIIIPALSGDMAGMVELNQPFVPWIIDQYEKGAEVASLCLGAFLLASTGLLNGRSCSTHWLSANEFRSMFPDVSLSDGTIITEIDGLYSSGGASSYWNLLLHIIEKYAGRELSIMAAKFFAIEIDRQSQSPFIMFNGQKKHEDEPVKRAQEFIEQNYKEKLSVEELADRFAIGRRHFERRFKKATNNTPSEYIQRVKVEAAKKQLENSSKNVNEVMYDVGYLDSKSFRAVFKKFTGLSPADYKQKYNRQAAAA